MMIQVCVVLCQGERAERFGGAAGNFNFEAFFSIRLFLSADFGSK